MRYRIELYIDCDSDDVGTPFHLHVMGQALSKQLVRACLTEGLGYVSSEGVVVAILPVPGRLLPSGEVVDGGTP